MHLKIPHGPNMPACLDCGKYSLHQKYVVTSRNAYRADKVEAMPESTGIYSVDMQKVLLLPVMRGKEYIFFSRLVCFNETFASLRNGIDTCILWHEAIAGRLGSDVASSFLRFMIESRERIQDFVFWADNCAPQNKNWILFSAFLQIVNSEHGPASITMKYLEPGHTFMKADSVHGCIGRKLKEEPQLFDIVDLVNLFRGSKSGLEVRCLEACDFLPVEAFPLRNKGLPKLRTLKAVQFRKGSGCLFYKLCHDSKKFFMRPFADVVITPSPGFEHFDARPEL